MTNNHTDDPLKDLEAALAVTPSPEFAEGVRARIHGASSRQRAWRVWTTVGLAAAAAIALAFVALSRREAAPVAAIVTASHAPEPAAAIAPIPAITPAPAIETPSAVAAPRAVARSVAHRDVMAEVLVPRDQAAALRALVAGLNDGTIDAGSLATPPPDAAVPLALPENIVIAPIVILSIDASPAGGSIGGEIRNPSAEALQRSR